MRLRAGLVEEAQLPELAHRCWRSLLRGRGGPLGPHAPGMQHHCGALLADPAPRRKGPCGTAMAGGMGGLLADLIEVQSA